MIAREVLVIQSLSIFFSFSLNRYLREGRMEDEGTDQGTKSAFSKIEPVVIFTHHFIHHVDGRKPHDITKLKVSQQKTNLFYITV